LRRDLAFPDCNGEPGCAGEENFLHDRERLLLILNTANGGIDSGLGE
jgi:hypothetical protein